MVAEGVRISILMSDLYLTWIKSINILYTILISNHYKVRVK